MQRDSNALLIPVLNGSRSAAILLCAVHSRGDKDSAEAAAPAPAPAPAPTHAHAPPRPALQRFYVL